MTPEDAIKIINDLFADQKAELQHDNMVDLVMKLLIKQFPDFMDGLSFLAEGVACMTSTLETARGNTSIIDEVLCAIEDAHHQTVADPKSFHDFKIRPVQ